MKGLLSYWAGTKEFNNPIKHTFERAGNNSDKFASLYLFVIVSEKLVFIFSIPVKA